MLLRDFLLERFFAKYEFTSKHLLCSSDVEAVTVQQLLDAAGQSAEQLLQLSLGYVESQGSHALRQAIARVTGTSVTPEQVLVFAGGQDALLCALTALVQPGDEVLAVVPTYQSLEEVPRALGAVVRRVWLHKERNFQFEVDDILGAVSDKTKVVTLVSPHNPTGVVLSGGELARLCDGLRARGVYLVCDEIYRELLIQPEPAAATLYEKALSVGGLAKAYGRAGLRIGWVVTSDTTLLARIAAIKDYTSICHAAPSEYLAVMALTSARAALLERAQRLLSQNLVQMTSFMQQRPQFAWRPSLSTVSLVEYRGPETTAAFCDRVVHQTGVLLMPGELFELPGFFRIGLGRRDLRTTLSALTPALG